MGCNCGKGKNKPTPAPAPGSPGMNARATEYVLQDGPYRQSFGSALEANAVNARRGGTGTVRPRP